MGQTLSTHIRQIKDAERVEVIATNPPFGGEEEEGILNNFPEGMPVKDTAVLFMQYVMARLKRRGGRCAIVVNNGYLSSTNIRLEDLEEYTQKLVKYDVVS